jgi:glycerophosphoryl diester phosphodiesterase
MMQVRCLFVAALVLVLTACQSAPREASTPEPIKPTLAAPVATPVPAQPTPAASAIVATEAKTEPTVLVVAHRGGAALAPENTLAAFENALQIGVDQVECDVHLSKDGELVIMHDPDVSRTTNGTGQIGQMTLAEIKELNAAAKFSGGTFTAQPPPTLGELLDLVKGKSGIQIEIKLAAGNARYPGIEKKVADALNAKEMTDKAIVISFDFPTLKDIKAKDARIKTGALVNAQWMTARMTKSPEQVLDEVVEATGADYFMPTSGSVSEALVKATHARGLKMGAWTVDATSEMKRLAGWGVDAITSNRPDELKRAMGR